MMDWIIIKEQEPTIKDLPFVTFLDGTWELWEDSDWFMELTENERLEHEYWLPLDKPNPIDWDKILKGLQDYCLIDMNDTPIIGGKCIDYLKSEMMAKSEFLAMANPNGCKCIHCTNHDLYRWATIMECKCGCHDDPHPTGHDGLCCPYPNGKRKDNPYSRLKPAIEYKKILDEWKRKANAL